ncbi:hypothetical protein [Halobacillus sp. A5]|uniref:hypothetical protein n=1 Tax=Halobacillus sp. A5 TaxID=2880263 RepID=UPI0020A6C791|nr:hypothetical protein [Halobacillus sp. A5]MCP3029659.1 hypothetical protein [Halobacillus sp. A5]
MKRLVFVASALLVMAGCGGNNLDLDEDRMKSLITEEAAGQKVIEKSGYKEDDISVVKACKAYEEKSTEDDFENQYIVYWETNDGEYERDLMLDGETEEVYYSPRFEEITDECVEY